TLDQNVPADLANALCSNDCVVTSDFSALEPDVTEHKYFAPGIGVFLEVETSPDGVSVNRLVQCNTDPKCAHGPAPSRLDSQPVFDRKTLVWAVLAIIAGIAFFLGLELREDPHLSATDLAFESLDIVPTVLTSVGVVLLFRVTRQQHEEHQALV